MEFDEPDSLYETENMTQESLITALQRPLLVKPDISLPEFPPSAKTAHPFVGGESQAHTRLADFVKSGAASQYKNTRNQMIGENFSTKLSAYLAHGCITARTIHKALYEWEEHHNQGRENEGTAAIRYELLWRQRGYTSDKWQCRYELLWVGMFGPLEPSAADRRASACRLFFCCFRASAECCGYWFGWC